MAKKTYDQDQTPDTTPEQAQTSPAAVPQQDPGLIAELERLRGENARMAAALAPPPAEPKGPGPQGIVLRKLEGTQRKHFHPKFKEKLLIDPASLLVDGKPPYLALPIQGSEEVRIRRIDAAHAALLLTCDFATGGQPRERLASDEEVTQVEAEHEARRPSAQESLEKDRRLAREGR